MEEVHQFLSLGFAGNFKHDLVAGFAGKLFEYWMRWEIQCLVAPFVKYLDVREILHAEFVDEFFLGIGENLLDVLHPFRTRVFLLNFLHYDAHVKDLLHTLLREQLKELIRIVLS